VASPTASLRLARVGAGTDLRVRPEIQMRSQAAAMCAITSSRCSGLIGSGSLLQGARLAKNTLTR
jgi:hypothetical protein